MNPVVIPWLRDAIANPGPTCIEWPFSRSLNGYGRLMVRDANRRIRYRGAHVVAYELANDDTVEGGLYVCHTCDNRACVNPRHLFKGTPTENVADCAAKGRQWWPVHLTDADVLAIRSDTRPYRAIAEDYGVTRTCIEGIKEGRRRANVSQLSQAG